MHKNKSLMFAVFALSLTAGTPARQTQDQAAQSLEARPPNIIVIMADDLGWGDIGANGASMIKTPNIDRIGREGVQLTSFYAAANLCTPSRAALLTGRYPIRSGMQHVIMPHSRDGLPNSEITLPEVLKNAGYSTGMVGKWHLGHYDEHWPTAHGFDEFFGVAYSNDMQPFDLYHHKTVVQTPAEQRELTTRYAAAASQFIADNAGAPFFLYYAETFPHIPLFVPKNAEGRSAAGHYGDVVEHLDRGIGAILQALDKAGVADNTLIIVTSDNGPWFEGDPGPYRDRKGGTHEGSYRVPFLARWPERIPAGIRSDAMAMNIDLLPTLASLAQAETPGDRPIDGKDIAAVLQGSAKSPHDVLFFFAGNDIAAVRNERFKLVLSTYYMTFKVPFEQFGGYLLFDLERDPRERFSYARENPAVVASLKSAVRRMRAQIDGLAREPSSPFPPENSDLPIGPRLNRHSGHRFSESADRAAPFQADGECI